MKIVNPSYQIESAANYSEIINHIERAARTCYKSESADTFESKEKFVRNLIKRGHVSTIEHFSLSVRFICDRGVSHEIVRHRLCAFSQESTRFCDYEGGVSFILPSWLHLGGINPGEYIIKWDGLYGEIDTYNGGSSWVFTDDKASLIWFWNMAIAERDYQKLLKNGWPPQQSRSVLPNSLKTELVLTANIREWRHILNMRAVGVAGKPHPQMLQLMVPLLDEFKLKLPAFFADL